MTHFPSGASGIEVSGAAVLSVIKGMGAFQAAARRYLAEQGIVNPQANSWYSQAAWLAAFRAIAEQVGPATLRQIGRKIPETAQWPEVINTVAEALASIDVAYHLNHRGGEIGHYHFEATGTTSGLVICDNPYPCAFDIGIIEATARRFSPQGVFLQVTHEEPTMCRQKGGQRCTYHVVW